MGFEYPHISKARAVGGGRLAIVACTEGRQAALAGSMLAIIMLNLETRCLSEHIVPIQRHPSE
ncbi:hypothetical protein DVJ77_01410 [Dyella tabacisoli]|uniref:Uncharacterized protein n=1 Tax=Dyella tabacisoli TaxID=2282381 RepID=A0A369UU89_9GAMM|nr:hypothetical protein DVJ77_01410 [Dyella tabacisoli]